MPPPGLWNSLDANSLALPEAAPVADEPEFKLVGLEDLRSCVVGLLSNVVSLEDASTNVSGSGSDSCGTPSSPCSPQPDYAAPPPPGFAPLPRQVGCIDSSKQSDSRS